MKKMQMNIDNKMSFRCSTTAVCSLASRRETTPITSEPSRLTEMYTFTPFMSPPTKKTTLSLSSRSIVTCKICNKVFDDAPKYGAICYNVVVITVVVT